MDKRIPKLEALINHPNTPRFEREAAIRILKSLNQVKSQVQVYKWIELKTRKV
jgi:hypothetical protein